MDDATGDYDKLIEAYGNNHEKIKIHRQPENVGPFKNKVAVASLASCDWICLLDSDNFTDIAYYEALFKEWYQNGINNNIIYTPTKALPNFNLDKVAYVPRYISKEIWNEQYKYKRLNLEWSLNLGNCVFHKSLVDFLKLDKYHQIFPYVDALYINWIAFNHGFAIKFVDNMTYIHTVHSGSTYEKNGHKEATFCETFDWYVP